MSPRTQIRRRFKSLLEGKTAAEQRINPGPSGCDEGFPWLEISTPSDEVQALSASHPLTEHRVLVLVEACDATETGGIYDQLDEISARVEELISEDRKIREDFNPVLLRVQMAKDEDGGQVTGFLHMLWECSYTEKRTTKPYHPALRMGAVHFGETHECSD